MQGLTTLENYTAHSSANEASLISSSHAAGYWRRFVPGVGLHPTLIDPHPLPLNLTDQASTRPMPRYFILKRTHAEKRRRNRCNKHTLNSCPFAIFENVS